MSQSSASSSTSTSVTQNMSFYTNPHSRGNTVYWMLAECEADYDLQLLHFNRDTKSADYLAINPLGKLPALVDNQRVITESGAICAYLAEKFSKKALKPTIDSIYLADYYRWMFFLTGTFDQAMIAKRTDSLPTGKLAGMSSIGEWNNIETVINRAIDQANPYLCGEQFTAADLVLTSYLLFAEQLQVIEKTPRIQAYLAPIIQREAFQKMIAFVQSEAQHYQPYLES